MLMHTPHGFASILAHSTDSADEKECVIQLSFSLFCPNTDLCGHNSLFVAERRALNSGSRQKGTCWKGGDMKWLRSKGHWSIMLEWYICRGMFLLKCFVVLCPFFLHRLSFQLSSITLKGSIIKTFSPFLYTPSWWCRCCSACWTGAWPYPWACCWNPSPCLLWRAIHPRRPRC